ncbi:g2543 [Coccomyxa viridis]|uniref:G2543 protein n=1 Tax=Coccomyxa viridis TaxID=1274662 RepID=A0ABP1FMB2_9CHLO
MSSHTFVAHRAAFNAPLTSRSLRSPLTKGPQKRQLICAQAGKNLSLHINETTVSFPLETSKAQEITSALNELLQTFKDKQAAERPKRWKPMEFRHKGNGEGELALLELFCNPNAYSTAFDAKILVTMKTAGGISVTTEGRLSAIKSDIDAFAEQQK